MPKAVLGIFTVVSMILWLICCCCCARPCCCCRNKTEFEKIRDEIKGIKDPIERRKYALQRRGDQLDEDTEKLTLRKCAFNCVFLLTILGFIPAALSAISAK